MSSPTTAMSSSPSAPNGGVIHDIGYQRYTGPRLGRRYATASLYVHALRTAYGLGRSGAAKVFPWGVFALVMMIAAILTAIRSQTGIVPTSYWGFPSTGVYLLVALFCAVVGPELVSRDLRSGVLPLYFSRPLTRADYPLAKWAGMVSAIFLLLLAPMLLMFLGGVFTVDGNSLKWHEFLDFSKGLLAAAVVALLFGSISTLVASLSGRRAWAAVFIVAVFLLTTPVEGILKVVAIQQWHSQGHEGFEVPTSGSAQHLFQLSGLVNPRTMADGVPEWLFAPNHGSVGSFGPLFTVVVVGLSVLCLLLTLLRYRKVAR